MSIAVPPTTASMSAARQPVSTGAAPLVGLLVALGLIALGVVGIQEALQRSGAVGGPSWTSWVLTRSDDVGSADWMLAVYAAAALLGLLLLLIAVRPRPRTSLSLRASTGVYLRTSDLARIADEVVEGTDGVVETKSSASRRRLKVAVTTMESRDRNKALQAAVREQLAPCLASLAAAPKVKVAITNRGHS